MAGNFSNYLEEQLLNHVFRGTTFTSPTVYVGIVNDTAVDTDLEGGDLTNEITGYTGDRKAVSFTAPTQIGGKGTIESDVVVNFEDMPATTVEYAIVCDAATGGNILMWIPATNIRTTEAGDTYRVPLGEMIIDLD